MERKREVFMKTMIKKLWNGMEGLNGLILILYTVFIFTTAAIKSDNFSVLYTIVSCLGAVVFSVMFCPIILRGLSKIEIQDETLYLKSNKHAVWISGLIFFAVSFGVFLLYYIAFYPGGFSSDSIDQYEQALRGNYNDWHPVIHTLIAFKLPLSLSRGWVGSIILFQIICFSCVLAYGLTVLLRYTNLRFTILSMCFVLLNPQTGYLAVYAFKDVSFAVTSLLVVTYALQIYATKGAWLQKPVNMVLLVVMLVLTMLLRHNAVLFVIPLILGILLCLNPKRGVVFCLGIILLFGLVKGPLYSALHVEKPDQRQVEILGLPMTVIGAAVTYSPELVDEETLEFAYKVSPKTVWEERYQYGSYNPVKWDRQTDNNVIEEYGLLKVLNMLFRTCMSAKTDALKALVCLTEPVYTVSETQLAVSIPGITVNEYGIESAGNGALQRILGEYSAFVSRNIGILFNLGFVHLLVIASVLAKFDLREWRYWKKLIFILSLFAYNYGTALLLTGFEDTKRFFYYSFLILPMLMTFIFVKEFERSTDVTVR